MINYFTIFSAKLNLNNFFKGTKFIEKIVKSNRTNTNTS